jgi:hypothetical protein
MKAFILFQRGGGFFALINLKLTAQTTGNVDSWRVNAMNIFEVVIDAIKPFTDGDKPPLHVGEVMNLWFFLTGVEQTLRADQVSYNIVRDPELKEKLEDIINNVHKPMIQQLTDFLRNEEVPLPETTPQKPIGDYRDIPDGAKLTDKEIADLLSYNLVVGIMSACRGITEAVRPDVAMMFAKFQATKITFGLTLKDLMVKRGWLLVPPYYNPPSTH